MEEIKVGEIWKDIEDYPNYQVSNLGKVKSIRRPKTKGGILKLRKSSCGYIKVYLTKDNKPKMVSVHRLVAQAFIPNPDNLPQVNHKDGNKENNTAENLEWVTASDNIKHRFAYLKQEPFRKYKDKNYNYTTKEGINEYARDYYKKNRTKILEYQRQWRNNKFKGIEYEV